jgi:hypothetical protein
MFRTEFALSIYRFSANAPVTRAINTNGLTTTIVRSQHPAMPTFGQPRVLKLPMNGDRIKQKHLI